MLLLREQPSLIWTQRLAWTSVTLAWMLIIYWLSTLSNQQIESVQAVSVGAIPAFHTGTGHGSIPAANSVGHLFLYGVLACLAQSTLRAWRFFNAGPMGWALGGAALAAIYGISDEYHQSLVPERTASLLDIGMNTLGAGVFSAGYVVVGWGASHRRLLVKMG